MKELGQKPICIESCPLRALGFGPIEELRAKYGTKVDVVPLFDPSITQPSLVIKASRHARPSGDTAGRIMNTK